MEDDPPPLPPSYPPSIANGFSGFILSINFSIGIFCGEAGSGLAPVTSDPGVVMGILEFGGRNVLG
jgi:hypothetical protein